MLRAIAAAGRGEWPAGEAVGTVSLDYDARHRRRIRLECDGVGAVLLDLPRAAALSDGDGLELEDGSWIGIHAAPEDLAVIRCDDAHLLQRIAWHLGNRHCPAEIRADRILIRRDHVIEAMLSGLGAPAVPIRAPFAPEQGAYGAAQGHRHAADAGHGGDYG